MYVTVYDSSGKPTGDMPTTALEKVWVNSVGNMCRPEGTTVSGKHVILHSDWTDEDKAMNFLDRLIGSWGERITVQ